MHRIIFSAFEGSSQLPSLAVVMLHVMQDLKKKLKVPESDYKEGPEGLK